MSRSSRDPGLATKLFHRIWARRLARRMPLRGRRFLVELVLEAELDAWILRPKLALGVGADSVVGETASGARRTGDGERGGGRDSTRTMGLHSPLTTHPSVVSACLLLTNRTYTISLPLSLSVPPSSLSGSWCSGRRDRVVTESAFGCWPFRFGKAEQVARDGAVSQGTITLRHISGQRRT